MGGPRREITHDPGTSLEQLPRDLFNGLAGTHRPAFQPFHHIPVYLDQEGAEILLWIRLHTCHGSCCTGAVLIKWVRALTPAPQW
jgi:hypothetical protein